MSGKNYKRAFRNIEPDERFEHRLAMKLTESRKVTSFGVRRRVLLPVMAIIVVAACLWILFVSGGGGDGGGGTNLPAPGPTNQAIVAGSVFIPKIELPKESSATMDMIGLIVYQGRVYTQTSSRIPPEAAKAVLGEKIGRTKGTIDEWSTQKDFAQELASTIGEQDVYTVKGYDHDFRIMTYHVADGQIWSEFYEALNGIMISNGADIVSKLKIMGNVQSATWEDFESWNNEKKLYRGLAEGAPLQNFLSAMNKATPVEWENLYNQGIYEKGSDTKKFLLLKLKDQSEIRLDLFQGGYVRYSNARVFFKLDDVVFTSMWESLK